MALYSIYTRCCTHCDPFLHAYTDPPASQIFSRRNFRAGRPTEGWCWQLEHQRVQERGQEGGRTSWGESVRWLRSMDQLPRHPQIVRPNAFPSKHSIHLSINDLK